MEMNLNFNLKELDNIVDKLEEITKESNRRAEEKQEAKAQRRQDKIDGKVNYADKMSHFTEIINGVAYRYKSKWVEENELRQELWVSVLELIDRCGGIEKTDAGLVATECYHTAIDLYRYNRYRYERKAEFVDQDREDADKQDLGKSQENFFGYDVRLHSKVRSAGDYMKIKGVIDLYPIGSRARKYLVYKIVGEGMLDVEDLDKCDRDEFFIPSDEFDFSDAVIVTEILGYKSTTPGSWCGIKRDMKDKLHGYFGMM